MKLDYIVYSANFMNDKNIIDLKNYIKQIEGDYG